MATQIWNSPIHHIRVTLTLPYLDIMKDRLIRRPIRSWINFNAFSGKTAADEPTFRNLSFGGIGEEWQGVWTPTVTPGVLRAVTDAKVKLATGGQ